MSTRNLVITPVVREAAWFGIVFCLGIFFPPAASADDTVDYTRDIRPILSDHCYACHGPDETHREGGFRLDDLATAFAEADSGDVPLVPGDLEASALYQRISNDDEDLLMPPPDAHKRLSSAQIDLIRRWIDAGAEYSRHWSFVPPQLPALPAVSDQRWPRNEIDYFVLARLDAAGLKPAPETDKATWLRRVTFDLTGLPPTLAELDAFRADTSANAYGRLVDRLLDSPRYGEHMARFWLDAARYGDTHGLHLDNYREMWAYRDWVIHALNRNLPFDQFTIEQLAGDLLPTPTRDQWIATGFNRCHVTTSEGGSITEEVYVRNVVDRVVTTGTVFLGLTFDCTRCHDHKFDPLTMRDFYSLFAFFNNLDGNAMDGNVKDHAPVVRLLSHEQENEIAMHREAAETVQTRIQEALAQFTYEEPDEREPVTLPYEFVWVEDAVPPAKTVVGDWQFVSTPVLSGQRSVQRTAQELSQHFFQDAHEPWTVDTADVLFAHVYLDPDNPPQQIMMQWHDGAWEHRAYWGADRISFGQDGTPGRLRMGELPPAGKWVRLEVKPQAVGLQNGAKINGWAFTQFGGTVYWDRAGVVTSVDRERPRRSLLAWEQQQAEQSESALPNEIRAILAQPRAERSDQQQRAVVAYYVQHVYVGSRDVFDPLLTKLEQHKTRIREIEQSTPTTLVFRERAEPRPAYILHRGEYDQQRDEVPRATPAILPPLPEDAPLDRLGLAEWLVSPAHPLTARVTVNRFWQQFFGTGLVKTAEDFGAQGEPPAHPQLLDWLAVTFVQDGWDVKSLLKRIALSATYRQSSAVTADLLARDPQNRLLARGARVRLDAEMIRDQSLALSELLVNQVGGPSVKPPQPEGLWFAVGYSGSNTVRFVPDAGDDKVHRRTLYTFIKRTAPPPQLSTFDAPCRESCRVRRERTNTPLQALLLMNDPQFLEASAALARRVMLEAGNSAADRAALLLRTCLVRDVRENEIAELVHAYEQQHQRFLADTQAARQLLSIGTLPPDDTLNQADWAAWTLIANLVLNLDEVINKN